MTWAAGERERYEEFWRLRGLRMEHQAMVQESLLPPSLEPLHQVNAELVALLRPGLNPDLTWRHDVIVEEEFEEPVPETNQNVW